MGPRYVRFFYTVVYMGLYGDMFQGALKRFEDWITLNIPGRSLTSNVDTAMCRQFASMCSLHQIYRPTS